MHLSTKKKIPKLPKIYRKLWIFGKCYFVLVVILSFWYGCCLCYFRGFLKGADGVIIPFFCARSIQNPNAFCFYDDQGRVPSPMPFSGRGELKPKILSLIFKAPSRASRFVFISIHKLTTGVHQWCEHAPRICFWSSPASKVPPRNRVNFDKNWSRKSHFSFRNRSLRF